MLVGFVALRRSETFTAVQKLHQFPQIARPIDGDVFAKQCLAGHFRRHDEFRDAFFSSRQHHGKDARHRPDFPFQRQLANENGTGQHFFRHVTAGGEKPQRDGKVQPRTVLLQIRRRQIHRHFVHREMVARISDSRVHALLRLLHRRGGEPYDIKGRKGLADIHLYANHMAIQAECGRALYFCIHGLSSFLKCVLHVMKFPSPVVQFHHFYHIEPNPPLHLPAAV